MSDNISDSFIKKQKEYYATDILNRQRIASPGSQYLVQLLKGGYLEDYSDCVGKRVLDVGCGSGFNLVSLSLLGFETYGCDIDEDIVEYAGANAKRFGCNAKVVVGENQRLPFPDNYFQLLISMNVIHYVDSDKGMKKSIQEYARVLDTGGRLILSTNHPGNWLLEDGEYVTQNLVWLNSPGDFRNGEKFFVWQNEHQLKESFKPHFRQLQTGENRLEFFKKTIRNYILTGIKR